MPDLLQAIGFVHALGKSKLLYTGHQSLWQSTEAVINAVLAWRHTLLKAPSQPGASAALWTSSFNAGVCLHSSGLLATLLMDHGNRSQSSITLADHEPFYPPTARQG